MPAKTPLHDRHVELGGRMVEFAGWMLPVQYEGVLAEHAHCRSAAVVFDTSHMGQFVFRGPAAGAELGRLCTQDAAALAVGRCRYGFLLEESGGVIDDTILMRLGEQAYLLVVNAGTARGDLEWICEHLGAGVTVEDRSAAGWGKLDVQGPRAAEVLGGLVEADLRALRYFGVVETRCAGRPCVLSRTGYTGELGYEVMARGEDLPAVFEAVLARQPVRPAGLGARDSLRLEMCYPLYGHELSRSHNPIEAGLGAFARPGREFIGAAALREVERAGPRRVLAALRSSSRRRANAGDEVLCDGRSVGAVTSGAFSPSLGVSIALAYVEPPCAEVGRELVVRTARAELPVTVADKPLYPGGTCRAEIL